MTRLTKSTTLQISLIGLGASATSSLAFGATPPWAKPGDTLEKCAGIAAKAQNDCGANGHSCAGLGASDNDPNEWVYMPKGLCGKVTGGKVIATKELPPETTKKK
jgi:uncharacterized membrane protein